MKALSPNNSFKYTLCIRQLSFDNSQQPAYTPAFYTTTLLAQWSDVEFSPRDLTSAQQL